MFHDSGRRGIGKLPWGARAAGRDPAAGAPPGGRQPRCPAQGAHAVPPSLVPWLQSHHPGIRGVPLARAAVRGPHAAPRPAATAARRRCSANPGYDSARVAPAGAQLEHSKGGGGIQDTCKHPQLDRCALASLSRARCSHLGERRVCPPIRGMRTVRAASAAFPCTSWVPEPQLSSKLPFHPPPAPPCRTPSSHALQSTQAIERRQRCPPSALNRLTVPQTSRRRVPWVLAGCGADDRSWSAAWGGSGWTRLGALVAASLQQAPASVIRAGDSGTGCGGTAQGQAGDEGAARRGGEGRQQGCGGSPSEKQLRGCMRVQEGEEGWDTVRVCGGGEGQRERGYEGACGAQETARRGCEERRGAVSLVSGRVWVDGEGHQRGQLGSGAAAGQAHRPQRDAAARGRAASGARGKCNGSGARGKCHSNPRGPAKNEGPSSSGLPSWSPTLVLARLVIA